jgi:hypothetical protein
MSSDFTTPGDIIWVSNGVAEEVERWCLDRLKASGLDCADPGRALAAFMEEKLVASGPGMYGFSVTEPPFGDAERRGLLADLVAELAREIRSSATTAAPRWRFLHEPMNLWRYPYWLSVMARLHAGIARSFEGEDAPPPLVLDLDPPLRGAVDVFRWMPIWQHYRRLRQEPGRWRRPGDPVAELDALDRHISGLKMAASAYLTGAFGEHRLGVLLGHRAELLELLGRRGEAAATWREIASIEPTPDASAIAEAIARKLDPQSG